MRTKLADIRNLKGQKLETTYKQTFPENNENVRNKKEDAMKRMLVVLMAHKFYNQPFQRTNNAHDRNEQNSLAKTFLERMGFRQTEMQSLGFPRRSTRLQLAQPTGQQVTAPQSRRNPTGMVTNQRRPNSEEQTADKKQKINHNHTNPMNTNDRVDQGEAGTSASHARAQNQAAPDPENARMMSREANLKRNLNAIKKLTKNEIKNRLTQLKIDPKKYAEYDSPKLKRLLVYALLGKMSTYYERSKSANVEIASMLRNLGYSNTNITGKLKILTSQRNQRTTQIPRH